MAEHQDYVYVEEQSLWGKAWILFLHHYTYSGLSSLEYHSLVFLIYENTI